MKQQRICVLSTLFFALLLLEGFSFMVTPMSASASTFSAESRQPRTSSPSHVDRDDPWWAARRALPPGENNLNYGGGPVMAGTTHVYAIFWEPTGNVSADYQSLIIRYFHDVGSSSLYRIAHQYTQANGGFPSSAVLAATWNDYRTYPASPLLDSDIQNEVTNAQRINGWVSSLQNIFFVFTERNENVCIDSTQAQCTSNGYCAYHSAFGKDTIYAALPYVASFGCGLSFGPNHNDADQTISGVSHEQLEAATDPLGNAWIDADGNEVADKCVQYYGHPDALGADVIWNDHPYLVQEEWDNHTSSCRLASLAV